MLYVCRLEFTSVSSEIAIPHPSSKFCGGVVHHFHCTNDMLKFAGQDSRCVSEVDTPQSAMKKGFLLQSAKENAETADTRPAPMDIDPPFKPWGKQARFVFVEDIGICDPLLPQKGLCWGQPHDKQGGRFRAQELAECLLQSSIEIRRMSPQEDAALAFLIAWVTDELDERDCLPETVQDMANIFADMAQGRGSCRL